ncbi:MAG: hypothetical protein Q4P18_05375 [Methanobrevibacter sp.]|uniref:hypothetical protein n=1 Tax=Methanobrevibacter sp. TaxID=66852 RepID=UPI0026DF0EEC|nr:hypothetical protein [Methanobrevibacter sp.]MDO5848944.1 hypothetical protein [Methanobrevibacter sp.]
MGLKPVLMIKSDDSIIKIRSRLRDDSSEHEIVLNSVLFCWNNDDDIVAKFLELFESVIKRTVNEIMPHKDLFLKYIYKVDNDRSEASQLEINLLNVVADDVGFKIEGDDIMVYGLRSVERSPEDEVSIVETEVEKHIETPEIVYKKYMERLGKK